MATIATVASLEGQAWAKAPDGTMRPLKVGDSVTPEEIVITAKDGRISLDFGDGHPVVIAGGQEIAMSPDLWTDLASDPKDAAVQDASVQEALTVLNNGGDLTNNDNLEATAAGLAGGGADEGHSFVQLTRVVESTTGESFSFGVSNAPNGVAIVDSAAAPAPAGITTDSGTVKEDVTTTTGGQLQNVDPNAVEAVFVAGSISGTYGTFTVDANGVWTYTLNNDDPAVQGLAEGANLPNEVFTVASVDGSTTTVTVAITGTNDIASIIPEPTMSVPGPGAPQPRNDEGAVKEDVVLTAKGSLLVSDRDIGEDHFQTQTDVAGAHGTFSIDADGKWTYTLNNNDPAVQALNEGERLSPEVFKVWSADGSANHDVTITITGTNDAAIITPAVGSRDTGAVKEDVILTTGGQLKVVDADHDQSAFQSQTNVAGAHGAFSIDASGKWSYQLNNADPAVQALGEGDTLPNEVFTVKSIDGTTHNVTVTITGTNDAAIITPAVGSSDIGAVKEDVVTSTSGQLKVIDVDTGEAFFQAQNNVAGAHGSFSIDGNGNWSYQLNNADPAVQALGEGKTLPKEVFTVASVDGTTHVVTVTITGTNDAPIAVADSFGTVENTTLTLTANQLLNNDKDTDNDALTITSVQDATHGSVELVNGKVVFTPADHYHGDASFTYTISDSHGGSSTANVSLNVREFNNIPSATNQDLTTPEDTPISGSIVATDADGDTLGYIVTTDTAHGTVNVDATTGSFTYTPGANYNGSDSFVVTVSDGYGGTTTSTIKIGVTPVNDAPVAVNDSVTTAEDTAITIPLSQLLLNDSDVDDAISVTTVQGATHGTAQLDGNGNVVFTPATNYNGPASFTYTITDTHGATSTATVTVDVTSVNDAPVAVNDSVTTVEDTAITIPLSQLLLNDSDVEGDAISVTTVQGATHGTAQLDGNGNVVFTPATNYNGPASFTYTITDTHGATSTATVTVDVTSVNDAPVAVNDSVTTAEDTAITIPLSQLLLNDSDVDGDAISVTTVQGATHGTAQLDGNGNVVFTPATNYNGPASFTYTITDTHGATSTATVAVNVTAVNDAPVAVNDSVTTAEDTAITIPLSQLLLNDSDVDGDAISVTTVQGATHGTAQLDGNGNVVFTPATNYNGPASFTYTITDTHGATSTATVAVNVTSVNDAPVAVNDNVTTAENTAVTLTSAQLLANDSDIDGDAITITSVQNAAHGTVTLNANGDVVFTPEANYSGPASFTYTITDGHLTSTATVAVAVTHVNTAPVAVDDPGDTVINNVGLHAEYYSYFEGPNGENLTNIDQAKTFIANHGPDAVFVATKFDYGNANLFANNLGNGTNLQKFLGADAATLSNDPADSSDAIIRMSGAVQLAAGTYNFRVYGDDGYQIKIDGKVVAEVNQNQAPNTTVHSAFTIDNGGLHQIEILYWDQGLQAVFKVEISNNGGASYSILSSETTTHVSAHLMNEDSTWTATSAELLANDSDADGDALSIVSVQNAVNGSVQLNNDGTVTFTPNVNYSGAASYNYTVSDGHGGTDTATVSIDVLSLNDRPQANSDILIAAKNTAAQGSNEFAITIPQSDLLVNDTDPDGNKLSITSVGSPVNGFVWIANGDVMFLPVVGFTGTAHFSYTISDNHGGSSTATADVMVAGINGDGNSNTISGTDSGETIAGLGGNDTIFGAGGNDFIDGGAGNDSIVGGSGNDLIKGGAGNDTLEGGSDNDTLIGGAGNDSLNGGTGNDLLEGSTGNDQLTGGAGADTFVWHLTDKGTTAAPATDTIIDFTTGASGDKLDIKDLLQNENSDNLSNYLHFTSNGTDTTISISSSGDFDGSNFSTSTDQTIVLSGVNLTGTDTDIINQLKTNGNLITD